MNNWSKVNIVSFTPKKEEKKNENERDWLEEVKYVKRKCKIKTEVAQVDYSKPIIHINNRTEISKLK